MRSQSRALEASVLGIAAGLSLTGCVSVGRVDTGVLTMNESVDRYNNNVTLLNIVRARHREPLELTNLSSLTGHNTLTGVLGLPTITLGPHAPTSPRDFAFGANSTTKTDSADFNVTVNDDPNSTAALMSPVDPGTLAFFINQGYDEELILMLFVKVLKIETTVPKYVGVKEASAARYATYLNTLVADTDLATGSSIVRQTPPATGPDGTPIPSDESAQLANMAEFSPFLEEVQFLAESGLKIQVDKFGVPSARGVPGFRICFDEDFNRPRKSVAGQLPPVTMSCSGPEGWIATGDANVSKSATSVDQTAGALRTDALNALAKAITAASGKSDASGKASGAHVPQAYWEVGSPKNGSHILFETRSVFEVFQYLGFLLREDIELHPSGFAKPAMLYITTAREDQTYSACFAAVKAHGTLWCIPDNDKADYNKQIFAVLRQIMSLYTAPSSQTNTPTVRAISE